MAASEWLLNIFGRGQLNNWEKTNEPVRASGRILRILQDLASDNTPCIVKTLTTTDIVYGNMVEVDKKNQLVKLKINADREVLDITQPSVTTFFRSELAHIHFHGTLEKYEKPFAWMNFPDEIYYATRRQSERVMVSPLGTAKLSIAHPQGHIDGTLFDLSSGGIGCVLKTDCTIETGEQFTAFIQFPDQSRLMTQMSVVHVSADPKPGYTRLGLEFCDLTADDASTLQKYIP